MAALNFQTWGRAMAINEALFSLNGGCGYVLRPEFRPRTPPIHLRLRIISAHNLPKGPHEQCIPQPWDRYHPLSSFAPPQLSTTDVVSPACDAEIVGGLSGKLDDGPERATSTFALGTTATISDNGLAPVWDDTELSAAVWEPDHAFLILSVANCRHKLLARGNSKHLLGRVVLPLCAVRGGYRSLGLESPTGSPLDSCALFCHIELEPLQATPPPSDASSQADPAEREQPPPAGPEDSVPLTIDFESSRWFEI